jgi:hypothetical protein
MGGSLATARLPRAFAHAASRAASSVASALSAAAESASASCFISVLIEGRAGSSKLGSVAFSGAGLGAIPTESSRAGGSNALPPTTTAKPVRQSAAARLICMGLGRRKEGRLRTQMTARSDVAVFFSFLSQKDKRKGTLCVCADSRDLS